MSLFVNNYAQKEPVRLLVRADDIASFHAANEACIDVYKNGIARSVEIMVPCPWFPEAAAMLRENTGYDVGVHLVLTSEWENYKWRPLTHAKSLTDENGYFYPMIWPNKNFPPHTSLREADWKIEEIEQEFRAQIETAMAEISQVSHLTTHMGCSSVDDKVEALVVNLAKEYGLYYQGGKEIKRFKGYTTKDDADKMVKEFIEGLSKLTPGTYLFVDHPAYNTPEMETIGHTGYYGVGLNRGAVTAVLTDERVKSFIIENNIQLISYGDLQ